MKKIISLALLLSLSVFIVSGCGTTTSTATKAMSNTAGAAYSETGVNMSESISGSMGSWAESGSISSGVSAVSIAGVKSANVKAQTITGPDTNGYYRLVESSSSILGTYEADLYVKLVSAEGKVTDIYIYGSYSYSYSYGGSSLSYAQNYGTLASPFHGTTTWTGSAVTKISISGSFGFDISGSSATEGSHSIAMTFTFSGFSLPVTSGSDYPTGTISVASTYDSVSQPAITLTFNGTATAIFAYGDYSGTITINAA